MFEKVVVRRSQAGPPFTLGELAEALLFYQHVHLVIDHWSLDALIKGLGPQGLLNLLRREEVTAFYAEDMFLTQTDLVGSWPWHKFHTISIAGRPNEKPRDTARGRLDVTLTALGLPKSEARRFSERLAELLKIQRLSSDYFVKGGLQKAAHVDVLDPEFSGEAARRVLAGTAGFEPFASDLKFEAIAATVPIGDFPNVPSFSLWTNIDFEEGNARRKAVDPTLESVQEATLLNAIAEARADAAIAAFYGGDFRTSAINSDIVRLKCADLLKRSGISASELGQFSDIVLDNYPRIKDVVDSRSRTFDEFLILLDRSSDRFRKWIHNASPDASLVAEYFKEIRKESWIGALPGKSVRFVLGQALNVAVLALPPAIGLAVGAAYSAADTFLLEKLCKGWRPSHFVDGKLKPFLDGETA
jgi:hypothetical protein